MATVTSVSVRARVYEHAIIRRDFTDKLCAEQRSEQFRVENSFKKMWKALRPKLDEILANEPSMRPTSYREAVAIATRRGGVLWGFGQALCRHVTGVELSEPEIQTFMESTPPFRAACYGLVMAWFDGALKLRQPDEPRQPGRNDLLMAAYLPYCGCFVTDDWAQKQGLRQIATAAGIECKVASFKDFSESFTLAA